MIGYAILAILIIILAWVFLHPIKPVTPPPGMQTTLGPASSYQDAMERIETKRMDEEEAGVLPVCQSKLYSQGQRADHVIVFYHGFSTCPEQFSELGKRLNKLGYNVFIPCAPYHGLSDRLTRKLKKLTAEDLVVYATHTANIACGLGRQVSVVGISGGGNIACWLAQNRDDISLAMPIAPLLGASLVPAALTRFFARLIYSLPDFYLWWDPRTRADNPYSVYYAYPGYSLHAMSEVLRLGITVRKQARKTPPLADKIVMVTNAAEPGVNNDEIDKLLRDWRAHPTQAIQPALEFEAELKLPHDIITPETPDLPVEVVYQRLVERIQEETRLEGDPGGDENQDSQAVSENVS
jgi:carboxylesterase